MAIYLSNTCIYIHKTTSVRGPEPDLAMIGLRFFCSLLGGSSRSCKWWSDHPVYKWPVYIGAFWRCPATRSLGDLLISHGEKPIHREPILQVVGSQIYSHLKGLGQKSSFNIIQPSRPKIWRTGGDNSMISYFHPESLGKMIPILTEHIFQMGWNLNHLRQFSSAAS